METKPEKSDRPSPQARRATRLEEAIASVTADIIAVQARHAGKTGAAEARVQAAAQTAGLAAYEVQCAEGRLLGCGDLIASLKRQLVEAESVERLVRERLLTARNVCTTAEQALSEAQSNRAVVCDEPDRHLAALQKDKASLEQRLEQHKARHFHASLLGELR